MVEDINKGTEKMKEVLQQNQKENKNLNLLKHKYN